MDIKVGDRVQYRKGNYVTVGTVETILYVGKMTARIITDEGGSLTLPIKDLRLAKETK